MIRTVLAIALAGFAAPPAFAAGDMTCADFMGLDAAGQAEAVAGVDGGMMASGNMMAADAGGMAPDDPAQAGTAACAQHPDMMLGEAMGMSPQ